MAKRKPSALSNSPTDDEIIKEAKRRFERCVNWESDTRKLALNDLKFANGDSDNLYQWPETISGDRTENDRPCITINIIRQHCLNIVNDAKQNKPSVNVRPVGNGATFEAAQIFEGVVRHIEYRSNAQVAYDTATKLQVETGIGYWRVTTDYADDSDSFDQEIRIQRVKDPRSIYIDPDIRERDGSDMNFAFVFDDIPTDDFDEKYPQYKDKAGSGPLDNDDWLTSDHTRVAEYIRRVNKKDKLIRFIDADGSETIGKASELDPALVKRAMASEDPETRIRDIINPEVQWFLIIGAKIAERRTLLGRYIPIVRCIGEETIIEGKLDRKGHVRNLKDAQRDYNYWASAAVEQVALQSKAPWITPIEAIEGFETYWANANTDNQAYLPYNAMDDKGQPLGVKPERAPVPVLAQAFIQGMGIAKDQLMFASGQYQSDFGAPSNEKSGVAIEQRQRAGDNATYHFIDNLADAIRYTGRILIDLIPKVYDTPRILKIMAEDGEESDVHLDPNARQAMAEQQIGQAQAVKKIFNPSVGNYDVEADVGPAYATKRQEAFHAFSQIMAQNKEAFQLAGDLMFKNADFPGAEELAERLRRMVPPQALGEEQNPLAGQMQAMTQHYQGIIGNLTQMLADKDAKLKTQDEQKDIDVYKAETDRMKAIGGIDPKAMEPIIRQMVMQVLGVDPHGLTDILQANAAMVQPSVPQDAQNGPLGPQQGLPSSPVPASTQAPPTPSVPQPSAP